MKLSSLFLLLLVTPAAIAAPQGFIGSLGSAISPLRGWCLANPSLPFAAPTALAARKSLSPEVRREVRTWWHKEGNRGHPKTAAETFPGGGRRMLRVLIDDPRYRGATGNATFLYFLRERSGWRFLMSDVGIGAFARTFGPSGYP